jgi:hypothetical protein
MKPQRLIIAFVVLAGLGGAVWYSEKNPPKSESESSATTVKMISVKEEEIKKIRLVRPEGDPLVLEKGQDNKWQITAPKAYRADESSVSGLVNTLAALNADSVINEKNSDWQTFGLDPAKLNVEVTAAGKEIKLALGGEPPTGSIVYARLAGDDRLFGVASYVKTSVDKQLSDLRDKRVLPLESAKLSKVVLTNKSGAIEFGKSGDQWQIVKPRPMRADTYAVDDLVRAAETNFESALAEDEKAAARYSFASPFATLEAVDPGGVHKLVLVEQKPKKKDDKATYYARSTALAGVFQVPQSMADGLDKKLDALRNKKIFDLSGPDPDKLELRDGAVSLVVEKKTEKDGDQWYAAGKKLEADKVNALLGQLRRTQAKAFASDDVSAKAKFGLEQPEIVIKLTTAGKVERAVLVKSGDQHYAARDNDATSYELESTDYADIKKYIGDLSKPAPPPAPEKK